MGGGGLLYFITNGTNLPFMLSRISVQVSVGFLVIFNFKGQFLRKLLTHFISFQWWREFVAFKYSICVARLWLMGDARIKYICYTFVHIQWCMVYMWKIIQ